jgi:hypothetical protein
MRKKRKMTDYEEELHQALMAVSSLQRQLRTMTLTMTELTTILSKLDPMTDSESPTQSLPEVVNIEPMNRHGSARESGWQTNFPDRIQQERIQEPTRPGTITSGTTHEVNIAPEVITSKITTSREQAAEQI